MKLQLKNASPAGEIQLSDVAFGRAYNEALVHQVVVAYQAAGRAGTKKQKSRAEVRGGGKKPWSQKGTGQARAGSIRSPIWVGGGRAFAARPRDFSQKVNRKMYRAAMQSMVSQLVRDDRLFAVESLELTAPKTKLLISKPAASTSAKAVSSATQGPINFPSIVSIPAWSSLAASLSNGSTLPSPEWKATKNFYSMRC